MVINYEEYFEQAGLVDIQTAIPGVVVDLKYATADNFMGEILYPDFEKSLSIASYDFTAGPGTCPVTGVKAGI